MSRPVAITGFGVVSPLGLSHAELARRFGAGERVKPSAEVGGRGAMVAEIPTGAIPADKRARIGRLDRLCRMVLAASHLACDSAGLRIGSDVDAERTGLSLGTGLGCLLTDEEYNRKVTEAGPGAASPRLFAYTVSSAAAGEVSIALGIKGPNTTEHMGFAAGLGALGYGFDLIQMGKADAVLAGGADVIGPALLDALDDMDLLKGADRSRPFEDDTPGLHPSEAAVVAVLEPHDAARHRGARCLARVEGYAAGFEPTLTRRDRRTEGVAATMRRALEQSGRSAGEVGLIVASAHGTPVDATELQALAEVFGENHPGLVIAPKAALAESFGASGPLGLALTAGLWQALELPADGTFALDGSALSKAESQRRLAASSVAMVHSLCYSGNVVALVAAREMP